MNELMNEMQSWLLRTRMIILVISQGLIMGAKVSVYRGILDIL